MAKVPVKWSIDRSQLAYTSWGGTTLRIPSQNHILDEEWWVTETDIKSYVVPQVNNTPVGYIPTAAGNASNLNEFIIDSSGSDKWFIDFFGNATKLYQAPSAGTVTIRRNSGADVGTRPRINFIEGPNITLTVIDDAGDNEVDVTIEAVGGAGAGYDTIQDAGTPLTQRTIINFTGFGWTVVDDGANTRTNVNLAPRLQQFSLLPGNGYVVQTGSTTFANRTIVAGSTKVVITNGDGVAANTSIDIDETEININNLGDGPLTTINGGTGLSSIGGPNQILGVNASGTNLEYKTVTGSGGITINHSAGSLQIVGSGSSAYNTVQVNGSAFTQRTTINFVGSTFSGADDISRTNVSISAIINSITDLAVPGYISRTGVGTTAARSMVAGSSKISITNGSGAGGNTVIDAIEANFNLNNISGVLNIIKGGTGLSSLGSANQVLGVNAGATALEYKTLVSGSGVTITHGVASVTISATGGSGYDTIQSNGSPLTQRNILNFTGTSFVVVDNTTRTNVNLSAILDSISSLGTTGYISRTGLGTTAARTFSAASARISIVNGNGVSGNTTIDAVEAAFVINNISGTLNINKGGTALTALGTANQYLAVNTLGSALVYKTLVAGSGISIVHAGTNTTISATGGGGGGTVTSVGVSSTDLSVSGSPITTSGTITLNINNDAVTFAKMQNLGQGQLIGRYSAGTGDPQAVQIGSGLAMDVSTGILSATGASNWTLSSGLLYPLSTATNVAIGNTTTPSSSYKLFVNGRTYISGETTIGGVLGLSALSRGMLQVRISEGGNPGGLSFHSSSGSTHGFTSLFDSAIWGTMFSYVGGFQIFGIQQSGVGGGPVQISGYTDTTGSASNPAINLIGGKRSGTGAGAKSATEPIVRISNTTTNLLTIEGDGAMAFGAGSSTAPVIKAGSGSPEGVVTARVGSLYLRTDGGSGTTLYVKESGTGNTGWDAK